jgi:hypothetical protein
MSMTATDVIPIESLTGKARGDLGRQIRRWREQMAALEAEVTALRDQLAALRHELDGDRLERRAAAAVGATKAALVRRVYERERPTDIETWLSNALKELKS